jgi:hypothetical protein
VPTAIEWAVLASDPVAVLEKDLDGVVLHATMERMGRVPARAQARVSARLAFEAVVRREDAGDLAGAGRTLP